MPWFAWFFPTKFWAFRKVPDTIYIFYTEGTGDKGWIKARCQGSGVKPAAALQELSLQMAHIEMNVHRHLLSKLLLGVSLYTIYLLF